MTVSPDNAPANRTEENRNALLALQWIIALAELEYSGRVTMGGYQLTHFEAADVMEGKVAVSELKQTLDLMKTDPKAYMDQKWKEISSHLDDLAEKQKQSEKETPALRNLPSLTFNANVRDQIKYETKCKGDDASEDWYDNWMSCERGTDIEMSSEKEALKKAAARVVWMIEARKKYNDEKFYIKTEHGDIMPARGGTWLMSKGDIIQETDNKKLSTDQKFYDEKGGDIYSVEKYIIEIIAPGRYKTEAFASGTPCFDDLTDESLVNAVNDYMKCLAVKSPFLSLGLAADASPILKGIHAPKVDINTRQKFWQSSGGVPFFDLYTDEALAKFAAEQGKEDAMEQFEKGMSDFIQNSILTIAQNNAVASSCDRPSVT